MATEVNQALAAHAQALLDEAAGRGQRAIDQVAAELEQFARLLVHQVRLRKALADPGLPPEPKRALLTELGGGRLDQTTVELLATAATRQRVRLRDFPPLLAGLAAMAAITAADKAGQLEQLEDELFFVGTLIEQQPQVRSALTNPGLPVENKRALVADLLDGRAGSRTAALADLVVELYEGHELDTLARQWAEAAAARRDRVVAEVRSAVELDDRAPGPAGRGPDPRARQARRAAGHRRRSYFGLSGRPGRGRAVRRQHPQPPRAGPRGPRGRLSQA